MKSQRASAHPADWIMEEHREVRGMLLALEELVVDPASAMGWRSRMVELLEELRNLMDEHFSKEEGSDLFVEFPRRFPRFKAALECLKCEHPSLLRDARRLLDSSNECKDVDLPPRLNKLARSLIRDMRRHERAESELVQKAYGEDIGAAD